jgi:hypothetical protein
MMDVLKFEKENPELDTIEIMASTTTHIQILRDKKSGLYYAKGPFGKENATCYVSLGDDLSSESKQSLLSGWREMARN